MNKSVSKSLSKILVAKTPRPRVSFLWRTWLSHRSKDVPKCTCRTCCKRTKIARRDPMLRPLKLPPAWMFRMRKHQAQFTSNKIHPFLAHLEMTITAKVWKILDMISHSEQLEKAMWELSWTTSARKTSKKFTSQNRKHVEASKVILWWSVETSFYTRRTRLKSRQSRPCPRWTIMLTTQKLNLWKQCRRISGLASHWNLW